MKKLNIIKILITMIFILVISNVQAIDATIELNKSSLPYSNNLIISIQGEINSTVNMTYDQFLTGADSVMFNNNNKNLSIIYNIPFEIENNNFMRNINLSNNNQYEIQFQIIDDIEFEINTPNYCFVNEILDINFLTPINTIINLNITGVGTNYNINQISSTPLTITEFIPTKIGSYNINSQFNYNNITDIKQNNIIVYEKLSCDIDSITEIYENESINFDVNIIGGIGTLTYTWDFDDSGSSNIQKPSHRFFSPKDH
ncbi:hypothetical protein HN415_09745, partial [Candidatus Woesearchaeota archaeon]|nr:hypothetical protein [Candidatus Woesearchaeota archaeon]